MASRVLTLVSGEVTLVDNTATGGGLAGDYNIETLSGTTKTLLSTDATFQYLTVTANTILDFPLPATADEKVFYIVNFGPRRLNIYVDGVDQSFNIRRNKVFLAHSAVDWNFIQVT